MLGIGEILADEVAMGSTNEDGRIIFVLFVECFILIEFLAHLSCGRIGMISKKFKALRRCWSPYNKSANNISSYLFVMIIGQVEVTVTHLRGG